MWSWVYDLAYKIDAKGLSSENFHETWAIMELPSFVTKNQNDVWECIMNHVGTEEHLITKIGYSEGPTEDYH